ncbi:hypothetical protein [Vibrio harveyi]|uniref:hypothetical protein n=1 Tax=Vibrio harveyi TaxID=669 RepID=UPI0024B64F52|nr:hypothetical protein [Vibrio harveyi]WHP63846.1 hypothetical protein QMY49_04635 [Vibrio harveyi]
MSDFQKVLNKLLQGHRLKQPFVYDSYNSNYREDLKDRLDNFQKRVNKLQDDGVVESYLYTRRAELQEVSNHIIESLDEYLSGSAGGAYDIFERLMNLPIISQNIPKLVHDMKHFSKGDDSLYRVRCSDSELSERKEMFHIPFHLRHLVGTQRYSIAGLPCLYLGTSIYVCWQEMGKPDLNKMHLSRYRCENKSDVKVINFSYSLETLKKSNFENFLFFENEDDNIELQIAYLVMYPLLMACSFNRAFNGGAFNIEYIIPNLLLQWISKEKSLVSGISYFSTKTPQLRHSKIGINFVFPPDRANIQLNGFCSKLKRDFSLTKPISWQLLDTIGGGELFEVDTYPCFDSVDEGFVKNYDMTKFYQVEELLKKILNTDTVDA